MIFFNLYTTTYAHVANAQINQENINTVNGIEMAKTHMRGTGEEEKCDIDLWYTYKNNYYFKLF